MKWYRPIPCDCTVTNPLICDTFNFPEFVLDKAGPYRVENYFFQGKLISNWPEDIHIGTEDETCDGIPDDVLQNAAMIPIFSKRLVETLISNRIDGFQFLPVNVLNYRKERVGTFYIANCIIMIDAFDYERSTYTRFPEDWINPEARGRIVSSKFVLREAALHGIDVFRMKGQPRAYFVSDRFVKLFRKHNFTGYSFLRVELS